MNLIILESILQNFKNELILEGIEISTGENLLKSIKKGMVPDVKFSDFDDNDSVKVLDDLIKKVKSNINTEYVSPAILLVLKKSRDIEGLIFIMSKDRFEYWFDSVKSYLFNKNKAVMKNNQFLANLTKEFLERKVDLFKDMDFVKAVNEMLADKAKVKDRDKEIKTVYKDSEGWEVYVPLTFAASKELACMNGRKSKWCTAADKNMFDSYSRDSNLYIIRNKKKDVMFQMDFGTKTNKKISSFMNEENDPVNVKELRKYNPPEEMLKKIVNKKGESLLYILTGKEDSKLSDITDGKTRSITAKIPDENIDGWLIKKITDKETIIKFRGNEKVEDSNITDIGKTYTEKYGLYLLKKGNDEYYFTKNSKGIDSGTILDKNFKKVPFKEFIKLDIPKSIRSRFIDEKLEDTLDKSKKPYSIIDNDFFVVNNISELQEKMKMLNLEARRINENYSITFSKIKSTLVKHSKNKKPGTNILFILNKDKYKIYTESTYTLTAFPEIAYILNDGTVSFVCPMNRNGPYPHFDVTAQNKNGKNYFATKLTNESFVDNETVVRKDLTWEKDKKHSEIEKRLEGFSDIIRKAASK